MRNANKKVKEVKKKNDKVSSVQDNAENKMEKAVNSFSFKELMRTMSAESINDEKIEQVSSVQDNAEKKMEEAVNSFGFKELMRAMSVESINDEKIEQVSSVRDNAEELEEVFNSFAFGELMRTMLLESIVDEKIEQVKKKIGVQLCMLAICFTASIKLLDQTGEKLKNILRNSELQRILDFKKSNSSNVMSEVSIVEGMLKHMTEKSTPEVEHKCTSSTQIEILKEFTKIHKLLEGINVSSKSCDQVIKGFKAKFVDTSEQVFFDISEKQLQEELNSTLELDDNIEN